MDLEREFKRFALQHEAGYFEPLVAVLTDSFDVRGKRVLDFGCGAGDFLLSLVDAGPSALTGVDISGPAIEKARQAVPPGKSEWISFHQIDLLATPDWPGQDLIISSSVLQYVEDLDAAFARFHDLLLPGGVLFATIGGAPPLSLRLFQRFSLSFLPEWVHDRFYLLGRIPGLRPGLLDKPLPEAVLKSNARYLGIPARQCPGEERLRQALSGAGFAEIEISEAPKLRKLSSRHVLIRARKP